MRIFFSRFAQAKSLILLAWFLAIFLILLLSGCSTKGNAQNQSPQQETFKFEGAEILDSKLGENQNGVFHFNRSMLARFRYTHEIEGIKYAIFYFDTPIHILIPASSAKTSFECIGEEAKQVKYPDSGFKMNKSGIPNPYVKGFKPGEYSWVESSFLHPLDKNLDELRCILRVSTRNPDFEAMQIIEVNFGD